MSQAALTLSPQLHSVPMQSPQSVSVSPATFQLIVLDRRRKFLSSQKCLGIEAVLQHLQHLLGHDIVATVSIRRLEPKRKDLS